MQSLKTLRMVLCRSSELPALMADALGSVGVVVGVTSLTVQNLPKSRQIEARKMYRTMLNPSWPNSELRTLQEVLMSATRLLLGLDFTDCFQNAVTLPRAVKS
jgi:hypothetical protein